MAELSVPDLLSNPEFFHAWKQDRNRRSTTHRQYFVAADSPVVSACTRMPQPAGGKSLDEVRFLSEKFPCLMISVLNAAKPGELEMRAGHTLIAEDPFLPVHYQEILINQSNNIVASSICKDKGIDRLNVRQEFSITDGRVWLSALSGGYNSMTSYTFSPDGEAKRCAVTWFKGQPGGTYEEMKTFLRPADLTEITMFAQQQGWPLFIDGGKRPIKVFGQLGTYNIPNPILTWMPQYPQREVGLMLGPDSMLNQGFSDIMNVLDEWAGKLLEQLPKQLIYDVI